MKKIAFYAALALVPGTAALAQPAPGQGSPAVFQRNQGDNSGPGSVGYYSPTGRAEDRIADDSAAAGNAEQTNKPLPNNGGGGGGSGGGSGG